MLNCSNGPTNSPEVSTTVNSSVATEVGGDQHADVTEQLADGIDTLVVAAATPAHPELILAALAAGLPVLCEKPVAADVVSSLPVLAQVEASGGFVQISHQRRFDPGDSAPPLLSFLATSGGLFRDCGVHDFDVIAWLDARRIARVFAIGSNTASRSVGQPEGQGRHP